MPDLSYSKFVRVYISIGALFTAIQAYVLITFKLPYKQALLDAGLNNGLILLSGIGTYHVLRNYKPARESVIYTRVWVVLQTIIISVVFNAIMRAIYTHDLVYLVFIDQSNLVRLVYNLLNVSLMSVFVYLLFYFKDEQNKQRHIVDAEKLTREAELVSLRQQLQPHFLFNSLNSISALVGTRPQEARKMIHQLSDFLRGTLRKDELETISLGDEIEHLQLYLDIEKVRFGHRLSTEIVANADEIICKIPPLILQPLVENAIKFGLYDVVGEVAINVVCSCTKDFLTVTITNPFDDKTSSPQKGAGFGLSSVKRRLYLLYGRNDLITTIHNNNTFTTTVKIPQPL
ncbi:MAG: histidine kinase [Bacteroidia bacterium]|nr:histidine kinase [Bacteroidia bacterium]MBP9689841.1 histidine kinase [Bacteroidia bacterium]